jgi:quercetin dioxygenase-like cupin family protein
MLKRRADEMEATPVAMEGVKDVSMRVMVGRADGAPNFAMRQFTVASGGHTPRHSHNYEHEVYVVAGEGRAECDGAFHDVRAGDVLLVEPNLTHQFVNTGEGPFEFLCLVPIAFDCGGGQMEATPGS